MTGLHAISIPRPGSRQLIGVTILLVCCGSLSLWGGESQPVSDAELPPVPIELYVSGTDPAAPAIRRSVAEVVKKFPRLKLREIDIDSASGRAEREKMEQEHLIRDPGEATLCIGPYHLVNRADDLEIQTYFQYLAARIFKPDAGQGRLEPEVLPFAKEVFGKDVRVTPVEVPDLPRQRVFAVRNGDQEMGWVADMHRPTRCPFCNDTQFLVALGPKDFTILAVLPIRPIERYGKDVPATESAGFTKQFSGQKPAPGKDLQVDGVVGATRTCGAYRVAIQELWDSLQRKK